MPVPDRPSLVVALALAACRAEPPPRPAPPASLTRVLDALPREATIAGAIDLAELRASRFATTYGATVLAHLPDEATGAIAEASTCGLASLVDRVAASSGADLPEPRSVVVALQGRLDREAALACLRTRAEAARDAVAVGHEGALTVYTGKRRGQELHAFWAADDAVAIAPFSPEDGATLDRVATASAADEPPLPELADLRAALDPGATAWIVGRVPGFLRVQLGGLGHVPDGFFASADLGAGPPAADVALRVGVRYADAAAARTTADLIERALAETALAPPAPLAAATFARLHVERGRHTVAVVAALTLDELAAVHRLAAARWPALAGPLP